MNIDIFENASIVGSMTMSRKSSKSVAGPAERFINTNKITLKSILYFEEFLKF